MGPKYLSRGYDEDCRYKIGGLDDEKWIYDEFLK